MLHRTTITSFDHYLFPQFWELYISAFPEEERRSVEYQTECMTKSNYILEALICDDQFIGFIGWWRLGESCYIEHFATSPGFRGNGLGRQALEEFIGDKNQRIILEVEHPTCDLSRRRIGFYSRIGFTLNSYHYQHPPYSLESNEPVSLLIMSYPETLSKQQMESFKKLCFKDVHFIHI